MRQQGQLARVVAGRTVGAEVSQQHVDELRSHLQPGELRGLDDGRAQLVHTHRPDQHSVLERGGELREGGAVRVEVGAHAKQNQGRRGLFVPVAGPVARTGRAAPASGQNRQQVDERRPRPLVLAVGEQLLELVDDK